MTAIPMLLIFAFAVTCFIGPLHIMGGHRLAGLAITATALASLAGIIATRGLFHV